MEYTITKHNKKYTLILNNTKIIAECTDYNKLIEYKETHKQKQINKTK